MIDFNFIISSNDNKLLGISIDTIFTILVTIFIFFLGFVINQLIQKWLENKRLKDIKTYYIMLIKDLLTHIAEYQELLSNLATKISEKKS